MDPRGPTATENLPSWRTWVVLAILALQLGLIGASRFSPRRYFCWAPHDQQTKYRIAVTVDGIPLSDDTVTDRYQLPRAGGECRATVHLLDHLTHYERTFGATDAATVTVEYAVNGGAWWRWTRTPDGATQLQPLPESAGGQP